MYIKPYSFPQSNNVVDGNLNQCTSSHAYKHIENIVPPSPPDLFPQSNNVDLTHSVSGHDPPDDKHNDNVSPLGQYSYPSCEAHEKHLPPNPPSTTPNSKSGVRCLYTNTDFLQNKIDLIEVYAQQNDIDIIALSEINNKFASREEIVSTKFFLPGFTAFQNDDGRGVLLLVKDSFKVTQLKNIDSIFSPSIF